MDEIGDVSPVIQTKLLRVLQEKEIKPLGDTATITVDVRIIGSTNQNLKEKIRKGEFREDFFYRLNVLPIHLPPLRERREDIPLLATHLLQKHCKKLGQPLKQVSAELLRLFLEHAWTGNIREMENVLLQGILFSASDEIRAEDIPFTAKRTLPPAAALSEDLADLDYKAAKEATMAAFNAAYIGHLLGETCGNVTQAARKCGLKRQALQQVMRRYEISLDDFRGESP